MVRRHALALGALLGLCAITHPVAVLAQQSPRVYRIGVLGTGTAADYDSRMDAFRQALRELGWATGRAVFDERWGGGDYERMTALAAELVALRVDVILAAGGTPSAAAAMKATRSIPIVFAVVGDPVGQKIVQSLAHPGGNITGLTNMGTELYPKRLALLTQAIPGVKRVALVVHGENPFSPEAVRISQSAGQTLGIQVEAFYVRDQGDFEKTFESVSRSGAQAVVAGSDNLLVSGAKELGGLALKHRLPLVAAHYGEGVLVAYNVDYEENYRRAAVYVDKILKGTKPGDLPIEQPSKFKLIVDLKTARALGLSIPQSLLVRADEVIQ